MPRPCCYMHVHQWMECILGASGFMSNRGRQNVASFLALDMGLEAWPCCDRAETDVTILLHFFTVHPRNAMNQEWISPKAFHTNKRCSMPLIFNKPESLALILDKKHFRIGAKVLIGLRVFWWTMMWPRTGVPCLHDQHLYAFGC